MEDLYNIRVVYQDMPATVKAFTVCKDEYYTIVLNSNLSYTQNLNSYMHELEHIVNNDFTASSANEVEVLRHTGIVL